MFQGFYFARPMPAEDFVAAVTHSDLQDLLASPVHRELADLGRRVAG
jgi:EAL domain-containing protein (putative c-di-GMP-specific phosphodiesterase class I)